MAESILELINEIAADTGRREKVTVLPLMCGTGKSTAISYKIKQTIEEAPETGNGLLIITDRKDRMYDYIEKVWDEELKEYLDTHKDSITIMHHGNLDEAYKTYKFRPVLMMTTQRFFRLTPEEIEQYLQWKQDDIVCRRPLILIDERPVLTTIVELDEKKIHDCNIAVKHAFQDKYSPTTEIDLAENAFRWFVSDCSNSSLRDIETINCFWTWYRVEDSLEGMRERWHSIKNRREKINSYAGGTYYEDFYTRIKSIYHLVRAKALFYRRWLPSKVCLNSFYTFLDNSSLLKTANAKTIILDGTAKFSPEYKLLTDNIRDYPEYNRSLEHLKIHIISLPTGKARMQNSQYQNYVLSCVKMYYEEIIEQEIGEDYDKIALFTYQDGENKFRQWLPKERVEHFGNIIGKNNFGNAKHIIQVGLNRYPDIVYYLYYLALHPEEENQYENMQIAGYDTDEVPNLPPDEYLKEYDTTVEEWLQKNQESITYDTVPVMNAERIQNQSDEIIRKIVEHGGEVQDIMNRMLFAEIEQNMFRGIIRNDCEEDYHFHLFFSWRNYSGLIQLMRDRYEPLGGKIYLDDSEKMSIKRIMSRKGSSHAKKFIEWHDTKLGIGATYTPKEIRNAIGIPETEKGIKIYEMLFSVCSTNTFFLEKGA